MNEFELIKVGALLVKFPWSSFNVSFNDIGCNFDPLAPGKNSIIAFADDETQKTMGAIADAIEEYLLSHSKFPYRSKCIEMSHFFVIYEF